MENLVRNLILQFWELVISSCIICLAKKGKNLHFLSRLIPSFCRCFRYYNLCELNMQKLAKYMGVASLLIEQMSLVNGKCLSTC